VLLGRLLARLYDTWNQKGLFRHLSTETPYLETWGFCDIYIVEFSFLVVM
jgi:hypothetical protein